MESWKKEKIVAVSKGCSRNSCGGTKPGTKLKGKLGNCELIVQGGRGYPSTGREVSFLPTDREDRCFSQIFGLTGIFRSCGEKEKKLEERRGRLDYPISFGFGLFFGL
jgi:hypothetical protein